MAEPMSAHDEEPDTLDEEHPLKEHLALSWSRQAGASFPKLWVGHLEGDERGVFAKADIAPGEVVLQVPRACLVTLDVARASEVGRLIEAHAPDTSEESYLAAFLLQEREREDSAWKPYLDVLPRAFPHLPLFFDARELSLLKGSSTLREVARWKELMLTRYAELAASVPGFTRFTPDAFLWAQHVLISRTFGLTVEGRLIRCVVPVADMLNHRASPRVVWGNTEDGDFLLRAREPVAAGEELHISYGIKPGYRFLLNYGFVPEDNPDDTLVLYLGIPEDVPQAARKRELLSLPTPASRRRFEVPLHYGHSSTVAMFSFLRVACADTEELARLTAEAREEQGLGPVSPLSARTEGRVLQQLSDLCEARLAGFDTTLEEDERLLREADLSRNERNCVLLRRGEKRLLHAYAGLARTFGASSSARDERT
ncbi:SET domain-containing histone-lysine N-methyltransferase [Corallococcus carmarthensis]|uniref:SET domain-containing protein-lysine N-methyltransferase n=1 Tax=Corallococcus carmarthensis TaxID=2316728 RepID=A0A3A8KIC0_9BACT|nr:SET domain-containing histone-lysine N-methyltransferase [Corallococcus carmarthensis]RKH07087.1 SET domain-containing protein-lysine N-methyltransferase [Corallococcus carmarthensis]